MPNDCWNYITITADKGELDTFIKEEFKEYNKEQFVIRKRGIEGAIFRLWSPCNPNFQWLEGILVKYPSSWLKNEWIVEDGFAGIWVGTMRNGKKEINKLTWEDMSIEEEAYRFTNN